MNEPVIQDRNGDTSRVTLFHVVTVAGDHVDDSGSSRGISNTADLGFLLKARSEHHVAITGGKTVRAEKLNSTSRCALCLVSNSLTSLSLPLMHPADGHDVLLASSNPELLVAASEKTGIECIEIKEGLPLAQQLVQSLGALGLKRVLLEGGPELIRAFVFDQLIDEVHLTVTRSSTELSPEEARSIVSSISYLPNANDTLAVSFDGVNNYLVWFPSGVAA